MRGYTIEMAVIGPMILVIVFLSIMGVFYEHDKAVVNGAAYETVSVGSRKMRERDGTSQEELQQLFEERVRGKCLLFGNVSADICVGKKEVSVTATASRKSMKISIYKSFPVTNPERTIRDRKQIGDVIYGKSENIGG